MEEEEEEEVAVKAEKDRNIIKVNASLFLDRLQLICSSSAMRLMEKIMLQETQYKVSFEFCRMCVSSNMTTLLSRL